MLLHPSCWSPVQGSGMWQYNGCLNYTGMVQSYSLGNCIRSNVCLDILSYMHDIAISDKRLHIRISSLIDYSTNTIQNNWEQVTSNAFAQTVELSLTNHTLIGLGTVPKVPQEMYWHILCITFSMVYMFLMLSHPMSGWNACSSSG